MNRILLPILRVLSRHGEEVIGSREIARELKQLGVRLSERTVRYHLKQLDEHGFTRPFGKEGRQITARGREELSKAFVSEKVGFVISRIDTLSYMTGFDPSTLTGKVILNVSYVPEHFHGDAVRIMKPVFASPYVMSDRVAMVRGGGVIGDVHVPEGKLAIGTVCSVTINGIFLKAGIPVTSKFGGLLEIEGRRPRRFVSLISYDGSSLDPLEIFIRSRMTDVSGAVRHGEGKVLASFREIPTVCIENALKVSEDLRKKGIGGVIRIGEPNNALYEVPVGMDRAGMVIIGGLNPIAVLEEAGIPTESKAMSTLCEYTSLVPFKSLS
jgi:hypothetical protein